MQSGLLRSFAALFVIVGFLLGVQAASAGCSVFESACTKTLPVLTTASVLIDDAQDKVAQAEAIVVRIADPERRDLGLRVIAQLRAGLVAAEAALHAAATACTAPDIGTVFAEFASAWPKIVPFISLLGGPNAGPMVDTPLVLTRGQ